VGEWVVLDWNQLAIDFYEKLGARRMTEWYTGLMEARPDSIQPGDRLCAPTSVLQAVSRQLPILAQTLSLHTFISS
jgi:hypothetical protein